MSAAQVETLLNGLRDTSGSALSGGKIYTYEAGTTTNKTTWTDIDKTSAAANPIILDANGQAQIYADGNYKFRVDDSDDNTLYTWDDLTYGTSSSLTTGLTSGGSGGAYTLTPSPAASAYTTGDLYLFTTNHSSVNTGGATLNVSSLGAKNIRVSRSNGTTVATPLIDNCRYLVEYDGTQFMLVNALNAGYESTTPTLATAAGSLANTSLDCYFFVMGGLCYFVGEINFDQVSSASDYITATLPFHADESWDTQPHFPITVYDSGSDSNMANPGKGLIDSDDTKLRLYREDGAQWSVNTGHRASFAIWYRMEE